MSVEITLYTKKATKTALIKSLESENFQKTKHFFEEMNTVDNIHYMWYSNDNYESSSGVEATVYKVSSEVRKEKKCSEWILHTRTRSTASYEDKQKQNLLIKKVRQQFGGSFYNDWYGTNKYINLNDYKKFSPLEKGLSIIANNSLEKLSQIENCLIGYKNEFSENINNIQIESIRNLLITKDPSIILYNSLMPFLVSVLEYFYSQSFVQFIKYDENCKALLIDEKIKIGVPDVVKIINKETSLEQIIMETYNFQNLESINRAYKKYISIDIFSVLSKKKKVNNNIFRILLKLQEILEARHKFVHELDINYNLTKKDYLNYISTVENVIKLTVDSFTAKNLNITIEK